MIARFSCILEKVRNNTGEKQRKKNHYQDVIYEHIFGDGLTLLWILLESH